MMNRQGTADAVDRRIRRQLAQPRVAEMVAGELRARIVDGELRDGDLLPKQDELLEEYPVGRPSIREALRILETEGLISVRRGNVGGAVVHAPAADSAAYSLGLVMQSLEVTVADLAGAVRAVEPQCAALCALREDRHTEVVPRLQALQARLESAAAGAEFTATARQFHTEVVQLCGNITLSLVTHVLENLWSAHEVAWAETAEAEGRYPATGAQRVVRKAHERVIAAIDKGDADGAARLMLRHISDTQAIVLERSSELRVNVTNGRTLPRLHRHPS